VALSRNTFIQILTEKKIPLLPIRRNLYRFCVADNKRNVLGSSCNVIDISDLFQLKLDYLEIISFKSQIKNEWEITSIKTALIQADRQTDKYEAKWRLCDCTNVHKIHMWQPRRKNHKAKFQLRSVNVVKKQIIFSYLPLGVFEHICNCQ
jgi:hypothetical protein